MHFLNGKAIGLGKRGLAKLLGELKRVERKKTAFFFHVGDRPRSSSDVDNQFWGTTSRTTMEGDRHLGLPIGVQDELEERLKRMQAVRYHVNFGTLLLVGCEDYGRHFDRVAKRRAELGLQQVRRYETQLDESSKDVSSEGVSDPAIDAMIDAILESEER